MLPVNPRHDDERTSGQGDNEVKSEDDSPHGKTLLGHTDTAIRKNVSQFFDQSAQTAATLITSMCLLFAVAQRFIKTMA